MGIMVFVHLLCDSILTDKTIQSLCTIKIKYDIFQSTELLIITVGLH